MVETLLEILKVLGTNLLYVAIAMALFMLAVLANIIASTYHNTHQLNQAFNKDKLKNGFIKMRSIALTNGILAFIVTVIPYLPFVGDMFPSDETKQFFTMGIILARFGTATFKYYKEASDTEEDILENRNIIDDVNENLDM